MPLPMLEELRKYISELIAMYEKERQRACSLSQLLEQKEEETRKYKEQITELTLQIENLRIQGAFEGGANKEDARRSIDKLIREIDKCIKLLEN